MATKTKLIRLNYRMQVHKVLTDELNPSGSYDVIEVSAGESVGFLRSRTGVSNPKWRATIKSGGNATSAMTAVDLKVLSSKPVNGSSGFSAIDSDRRTYSESISGTGSAWATIPAHVSGTSVTTANNQALARAYDGVNRQRNQFQGLVFLGELRETIKMLKHPFQGARTLVDSYFKQLTKTSKAVKRHPGGVPGRTREFLRVASETWLETAFGIMPLVNDAKELAQTVARAQYDSRRSMVVTYGSDSKGANSSLTSSVGNYSQILTNHRDVTTQSVRYKVAMDYTKSAAFGSAERLQELSGLTLQDFVPSLYELIPWSFLVDYFSNLGDIVSAGCTSQENVAWCLKTERLSTIRTSTHSYRINPALIVSPNPHGYSGKAGGGPGESVIERTSISRSSSATLALPTFEVSLPGRDNQWVNIAALWGARQSEVVKRIRF